MKKLIIIIWLLLGAKFVIYSQIPNGAIFHLPGDNKVKGELSVSDTAYHLRIYNNTVLTFKKYDALKAYFPDEIYLFSNGKFNYKKGLLYSYELTAGLNHTSNNLGLSYASGYYGLEYGLTVGAHWNSISFTAINNWIWLDINSYTFSGVVKYFPFNNMLNRPYAKASIGYANNSTWNFAGETSVSNSALFEFGIGFNFSSKGRIKYYLELVQYNMKVNGTFTDEVNTNQGVPSVTEFNLWLNRFMVRFGLLFGK